MTKKEKLKQQITDKAIELAEASDWESVRLNDVAEALNISLNEVRECFREKEDIVDAWFDQADAGMLKTSELAEFEALDIGKKLHMLLINWLASLAPHRKVTRQMILGKLEPGHLHYQVNGLLRISRTVQWWRDAAGIHSTLPRRAIDETILTAIYVSTFVHWMNDTSDNFQHTQAFLKSRLDQLARLAKLFDGTDVRSDKQSTDSAQHSA